MTAWQEIDFWIFPDDLPVDNTTGYFFSDVLNN